MQTLTKITTQAIKITAMLAITAALPLQALAAKPLPENPQIYGVFRYEEYDEALTERLSGRILLQVEEHGEAWYINQDEGVRYYMKDGEVAYQMMREFGLGITNQDLAKIPDMTSYWEETSEQTKDTSQYSSTCNTNELAGRLAGRILLQTEEHGEAYYVDPVSCNKTYMKDGDAAYTIMRYLGLGITNKDIRKIPTIWDTPKIQIKNDHVLGDLNTAKIVMIEYADIECPFCSRHFTTLKEITTEHEGEVAWIFRHFPLTQIHNEAIPAAIASECAAEQDKFWEMTEALSVNYNNLNIARFDQTARDINLDMDKFTSCMKDNDYEEEMARQLQIAAKAGVAGTPTTFINQERVSGAQPKDIIEDIIKEQL